jgi:hypothetical protein
MRDEAITIAYQEYAYSMAENSTVLWLALFEGESDGE